MVLTLYSEIDCKGQSAVVRDKEVNLTKAGVSFKVKVCSKQISYLRNTCNVQHLHSRRLLREILGSCSPLRGSKSSCVFLKMEDMKTL